jgi:hypothetical protein
LEKLYDSPHLVWHISFYRHNFVFLRAECVSGMEEVPAPAAWSCPERVVF